MAALRTWPWRLLARLGTVAAPPRPPVDVVIVLARPWWARLVGSDASTAWGVLGPALVLGGAIALAAGAGFDAVVVVVTVGLLLCEVLRRNARVGLRIDAEGWHVQNLFVRRDVPWPDAEKLWLAGSAHATLETRRHARIRLAALGGIGPHRRAAWLAQVAPVARSQGVELVEARATVGSHSVPMRSRRGARIAVGVLCALGAVAAVLTILAIPSDLALSRDGVLVEAEVLDVDQILRPNPHNEVEVRFRAETGEQVRSEVATRADVGPTIDVRYDAADPDRTRAVHQPAPGWWDGVFWTVVLWGGAAAASLRWEGRSGRPS